MNLHLDTSRRRLIMNNHTGTHVLNYALRKAIGETDQKGSLVAADKLRFDFSNKGALSTEQVRNVELYSQELIARNEEVYARESSLGIAKSINGLRAVFDETYPDPVRVVSIGIPVELLESDPLGPAGQATSIEFCGGTHLRYSGHIGDFIVASEEAIAKGIRRIVALTGPEATKALKRTEALEKRLETVRSEVTQNGSDPKAILRKIIELNEEVSQAIIPCWRKDNLRNDLNNIKKTLDVKERAAKAAVASHVVEQAKQVIGENLNKPVLVHELKAFSNTKALDSALKHVKTMSPNTSAMFVSVDLESNKIFCLTSVSKDAIAKGLKANEWVGAVSSLMGGRGGGRAESAQASGSNAGKLDEVLAVARKFAATKLS